MVIDEKIDGNFRSKKTNAGGVCRQKLSSGVHTFVVFLVIAGGDVVHPRLIVEIPADGLFDAFLKLQRRLPTEFALQF